MLNFSTSVVFTFQRAADGGGINLSSSWLLTADHRDQKYVLTNYINKGLAFDDPRRPDLIKFYLHTINHQKDRNTFSTKNFAITSPEFNEKIIPFDISFVNERSPFRALTTSYYHIRLCKSDFFISSTQKGFLDLNNIHYREHGSNTSNHMVMPKNVSVRKEQRYQQLEIRLTTPGNYLLGNKPRTTVLRAYFIALTDEPAKNIIDLHEVYVIDGKAKTIQKCQVDKMVLNPQQPILRFLKNGRVVLDDEITAPSFFELSEKWWSEKVFKRKLISTARRKEKFIESSLHRNMQIHMPSWRGPNIGPNAEHFLQGGDFASQLESLGSYCTNLSDKYGDVFKNRSEIIYNQYLKERGNEAKLIWMSRFEEQWVDLERTIRRQDVQTTRDLINQIEPNKQPFETENVSEDNISYDEFEMGSEIDFENNMKIVFVDENNY
jgi:hypothetical protein